MSWHYHHHHLLHHNHYDTGSAYKLPIETGTIDGVIISGTSELIYIDVDDDEDDHDDEVFILMLMLNKMVIMMTMKIPSCSDLKIMMMIMMLSASDVLDHLNDLRLAMSEIKRILKPNGLLVFDTINRTWGSYLWFYLMAQGSLSCNVTTTTTSSTTTTTITTITTTTTTFTTTTITYT